MAGGIASKDHPIRDRLLREGKRDKTWTHYPNPPTSRNGRFDDGVPETNADDSARKQADVYDDLLAKHDFIGASFLNICIECGRPCRCQYCLKCRSARMGEQKG